MTARKVRPNRGDDVKPGMSIRDMAACIGVSKSELARWRAMADIPEPEFERRLKERLAADPYAVTSTTILRGAPVPTRGRVERTKGIIAVMTRDELAEIHAWIASRVAV